MKGNMEHSEVRARTDWVVRGMAGEDIFNLQLQDNQPRQPQVTRRTDLVLTQPHQCVANGVIFMGRAGINYEAKSGGLAGTFSLTLSSL